MDLVDQNVQVDGNVYSRMYISNVSINSKGNLVYCTPGSTFNLTFTYLIELDVGLTNPNVQFYVGLVDTVPRIPLFTKKYVISTVSSSTDSGTVTYSNIPVPSSGVLYIAASTGTDFNSNVNENTVIQFTSDNKIGLITTSILNTLLTRTIYDDTEAGTIVYEPSINVPSSDTLNFYIGNSADVAYFIIDSATGEVNLIKPQSSTSKPFYTFTIYVIDTTLVESESQTITINNVARSTPQAPVFSTTPGANSISIYDNILPGTFVYSPNVINTEGNPLQYFLSLNDFNSFFINSTTGEVRILKPQTNSNKQTYTFTITVKDSVTKLSASQIVTITNNARTSPAFLSPPALTVFNDIPVGTFVYAPKVTNTEGNTLQFSFAVQGGDNSSLFSIDPTTGAVHLMKLLVNNGQATNYTFTLQVLDIETKLTATQAVTVSANPHTGPTLAAAPALTVFNDIPVGTFVYAPKVTNTEGNTLQFSFAVQGGDSSSLFSIDPTTGAVHLMKLLVNNNQATNYIFTLQVLDIETKLTTTQLVTVTANPHVGPGFDNTNTITVFNDIPVGTFVYAPNIINTEGYPLQFSFAVQGGDNSSLFSIDSTNGAVHLMKPLVKNGVATNYTFTVQVLNLITKITATQLVTVTANPHIGPIFAPLVAPALTVFNDIPVGTFVYAPKITNTEGNDLQFSLAVQGGDNSSLFSIDQGSGAVHLMKLLVKNGLATNYIFTVQVLDLMTKLTATQLVTVTANPHIGPIFAPLLAPALTVFNDIPVGTFVYAPNITNTEGDALLFSFAVQPGDNSSLFSIDPGSGSVNLMKLLVRNAQITAYTFTVQVLDLVTKLTATQLVTVNATPHTPPAFISPTANITIFNDTPATTLVYGPTISNPEGNALQFTFNQAFPGDSGLFIIDPNNGEVRIMQPNPAKPNYTFAAKVVDIVTKLSATQQITITAQAHIPPVFIPAVASIRIFNDTLANTLVYAPTVSNIEKNPLQFSFLVNAGDDSNLFIIDPTNGEVRLTQPNKAKASYKFTLQVTDFVTKLITTQQVTILNVPRIGPTFYDRTVNLIIAEDVSPFTTVYGPRIRTDAGNMVQFFFNNGIIDDRSNFIIDSTTGEIRIIKPEAFTIKPTYTLNISVTDIITGFSDQQTIIITNVQGTPYFIDGPAIGMTVYDDITITDEIYRPQVNVLPEPIILPIVNTTNLVYSLVERFDYQYFTINSSNGHVFFNNQPSVKGIIAYNIQIKVMTTNNKYALQQVTLNIKKRPPPPIFTRFSNTISIKETLLSGALIYQFTAISQEGNEIKYDVVGTDKSFFTINKYGSLSLKNAPVFAAKSFYAINIKATDLGNSQSTTSALVTTTIISLLANPYFAYGDTIVVPVNDRLPNNSLIYTVDIIHSPLGLLSGYAISSPDLSFFTFNPTNGSVTLINTPNFIKKQTYNFKMRVNYTYTSDGITKTLILIQTVVVQVDVNLCTPGPPNPPNLSPRETLRCQTEAYNEEINMRRKAEILKYKKNQNNLTKKQLFSKSVNGNSPLGKKIWATQNDEGFSNPNVSNLQRVNNTLILCPNPSLVKCAPTAASNVPGNTVLCDDPAVPLVNYGVPRRTYLASSTKWPQTAWRPGFMGFPVGKKGGM